MTQSVVDFNPDIPEATEDTNKPGGRSSRGREPKGFSATFGLSMSGNEIDMCRSRIRLPLFFWRMVAELALSLQLGGCRFEFSRTTPIAPRFEATDGGCSSETHELLSPWARGPEPG